MANKAEERDLIFRPHFKTHQSIEIGRWFRAFRVHKIAVSSLSMAAYFAQNGWDDITVAFPFNLLEMEEANALAEQVDLNLLVESKEVIQQLDKHLEYPVNIFVKVNLGNNRTGVDTTDFDTLDALAEQLLVADKIGFMGFLGHAGHSYTARGKSEILQVHKQCLSKIATLKERYQPAFPDMIISYGDTPTCSVADDFPHVDELRPGNFVFYDLMQHQIGACEEADVAVAMACPVVSKHLDRNEIVIYGGAVHFSKEFQIGKKGEKHFGKYVSLQQDQWGPLEETIYLKSLSQEHGIVHAPDYFIEKVKEGELLTFLPIHSCLTANLMPCFQMLDGDRLEKMKLALV